MAARGRVNTTATPSREHPPPERLNGPLGWLGRRIVRHPWQPILLWVAILAVALLPAADVGSVINGSFSNPLPSHDASVLAQNEFDRAFPNASSSPSSAIVLLEAPDITGPAGKNATLALTAALEKDPELHNVSSVDSLYSATAAYLAGQVELGWSFLGPALSASPSLTDGVNATAAYFWEPAAIYLSNWEAQANASGRPGGPSDDLPAYNVTRATLGSNAGEVAVLEAFYPSFNGSVYGGCLATASGNVSACVDAAMLRGVLPALPNLLPPGVGEVEGALVVTDLGVANWSARGAQEVVASIVLGASSGIAPAWILTIWNAFPAPPTPAAAAAWAGSEVATHPLDALPLAVPSAISAGFVNGAGTASLVLVSFNVPDTYTVNGASVTFADVGEITNVVGEVLASSPAYAPIGSYVTGGAPLDRATNDLATSALSVLLALTILVLLIIMLLYFRSPSAPALAFGMIGIALGASLAMIFVVGKLVTTFNSEIESIILVFLMSIGTDYSVFLLARYREELVRGTPPKAAVATTVRWAGQSIATSGTAVMVVALALTLSNISFLVQLGICLLIAVAFALAVNLTVLPAILTLVGPRIFWPNSGARFERYAARRRESVATHRDPIARAGRAATRRPLAVVGIILLLSVPVVVVALEVPVSYDITNLGLPSNNPAQRGFVHLDNDFGASYSSTSFALVTFDAPVLPSAGPNATELTEVQGIADTVNATPGVAATSTFVGSGGAPLATWLNYSALPPAVRIELGGALGQYVGADGRTVLFDITTNASGYSATAVSVIDAVQQRIDGYRDAHGGIAQTYVGGAGPTTKDIQSLVNSATEEMLIGAAIGLFVIMLILLGSAFVPLLALGVIGLSILWSWAGTYFVVGILENEALIFLLPLILLILVLGLGMDYNVLLLTRVKEERELGNRGAQAIRDAVTHAGGVITAAAVILGGAFLLLGFTSPLGLLAAIGLGIGFAVLLQAFVVQLFFTPAVLTLGKDSIWRGGRRGNR
jgi:uncharacterized membrane protein YdfJ with MMPL/SSD domain